MKHLAAMCDRSIALYNAGYYNLPQPRRAEYLTMLHDAGVKFSPSNHVRRFS
jgi:hypothetical protein